MITRRAGGAGSPRIAICLAPARNGAIRPTGTDRRLCGHTPCERCVVWVRGSPMCPCCANRAMAYGSQLQGAGPLPPLDARNRQAVPEGGAGKPPPASGQGRDRRVDLISRGEAPARARSRTPAARTASPRRPASPDGRTGGEESGPPEAAAPRRTAEASPGAPRPASPARRARDEERSPRGAERPRNNMESSEEEEVTDEEEDREGLYRNIAGSKGDWAERPERAGGDWESHHRRECMNPHCNRPARGSDEICCGRCTETQGREHSFNCNARTVYGDDKRRSGRPWGGGDGGNGPPDRGDPNRRRGSGGGKPSKKPSKAARDRERNLFRKGGKGKRGRSHLQLTFGKALKLAVATATSRSRASRLRTWDRAIQHLRNRSWSGSSRTGASSTRSYSRQALPSPSTSESPKRTKRGQASSSRGPARARRLRHGPGARPTPHGTMPASAWAPLGKWEDERREPRCSRTRTGTA